MKTTLIVSVFVALLVSGCVPYRYPPRYGYAPKPRAYLPYNYYGYRYPFRRRRIYRRCDIY